jgi:uncharacterized lipoprotein YddW (UPF0748 family)
MKKKFLFYILCMLFVFPGLAKCQEPKCRGLFVTMIQNPQVLSSRKEITKLIDFAKKARIKILFVQIYRANQSWFPSQVADSGPYETGLQNLSEDPFALLIKQAHAAGIQVHAWLNMLSLSTNKDAKLLRKYGTDILTRNLKEKKKIEDYKIDDQYFLEPGDPRIQEDLAIMVEEILRAYPSLDGVQFDYIRYPDKNPAYGYTKINIERFKKATGLETIEEHSQVWEDWKRAQVTEFLELLVKRTRKLRPDIQISATGCMPYVRAYYEAFQDWPSWLKRGLVDFVTMMSYSPDPSEFEKWIASAKTKTEDFKKVNIGVGAYKLVHAPRTFEQEFRLCEKAGGGCCVVLHYGSLLENPSLGSFLSGDEDSKGK